MKTLELQYNEMLAEARGYYKTISGAVAKQKFNSETRYSILTMAIEKYLVAFLLYHSIVPSTHTLVALIEEIKFNGHTPPEGMKEHIQFIDSFLYICAIDNFYVKKPSETDVEKMCESLNQIAAWVESSTSA